MTFPKPDEYEEIFDGQAIQSIHEPACGSQMSHQIALYLVLFVDTVYATISHLLFENVHDNIVCWYPRLAVYLDDETDPVS